MAIKHFLAEKVNKSATEKCMAITYSVALGDLYLTSMLQ
jgi:hypothetical protein